MLRIILLVKVNCRYSVLRKHCINYALKTVHLRMTEVVVFSDGFMEFKIIIFYLIIKKAKQTIFGQPEKKKP